MANQSACNFSLSRRLCLWIATGWGVGLVSPAPGTIGGLWGVPLALAIFQAPILACHLATIALLVYLSVWVCSRALGILVREDPQEIVLDEIVALPVVFLGTGIPNWRVLLLGWFLFRLFDISKPPPARQLESLPGGWGIVADDIMAAVYGCAVLHGLLWLDRTLAWGLIISASAG